MRKEGLKNVTHTEQKEDRKRGINYLMTLCKWLLEQESKRIVTETQESIDLDSPVRTGLAIIKLY